MLPLPQGGRKADARAARTGHELDVPAKGRRGGQQGGARGVRPAAGGVRGGEAAPDGDEGGRGGAARHGASPPCVLQSIRAALLTGLGGMGQVKAPQVTSFVFHPQMLTTLAAVGWLVYCTYAPSMKHTAYAHLFAPGNFVLSFFPPWMLRFAWGLLIFFHGLESLYVANLCRKHQTGLFVGVRCMLHAVRVLSPRRSHADVHVPLPRCEVAILAVGNAHRFPDHNLPSEADTGGTDCEHFEGSMTVARASSGSCHVVALDTSYSIHTPERPPYCASDVA